MYNKIWLLWWPFWKWRPVEIFRCPESIHDVEIEQCWICVVLWQPFWKWRPVEIVQCQESIRDIIIYPHMKWRWNWTMLNLCCIVVAILKMVTGRNFSMSGYHYLPTYQILMISDNVEFLPPIFYAVFWQPLILKTQNCSSNGDLSLCQILCLYHNPFRSYQH